MISKLQLLVLLGVRSLFQLFTSYVQALSKLQRVFDLSWDERGVRLFELFRETSHLENCTHAGIRSGVLLTSVAETLPPELTGSRESLFLSERDTVRTWYKRLLLYSLSYWHRPYMMQDVTVVHLGAATHLPSCRHKLDTHNCDNICGTNYAKFFSRVEVCFWLHIGRPCLVMRSVIM